ncbi:MAG: hypothetical protein H7A49_04520 [Akkermansiaceae bacterium]|nr:hypothetical protein [Akkermansiaceae bacterium]MCP5546366.1 hypothetical protein [Akkermansiaceae bacterium]
MDPVPPPIEEEARLRRAHVRKVSLLVTSVVVLGVAGFFRWAFATNWFASAGGVVSLSFIASVPFACGALSVTIGRCFGSDNWPLHAIFVPFGTMLLGLAICVVAGIEAILCVIMAAPIVFVAAVLGGLLAHFLLPRNHPKPRLQVTLAVFLPVLAAWGESAFRWPSETKDITNTIRIHAPAARIWPEITSVRPIDPEKLRESWIYQIGFPRPIAAEIDRPGVGGTRTATFERDVSFFETVTVWDEPRILSFTIHADPEFIPHTAFDKHIIVGGRFYDVLDGTYRIEPVSDNESLLHLTSRHRLGTRFNSYAAWWSVRIMDEIQGTILEVIRTRAENEAKQP